MADPEWHWADPIVLNFNRHPPSSELTFVNWVGPDSLYKWNEVRESGRTRLLPSTLKRRIPTLIMMLFRKRLLRWINLKMLGLRCSVVRVDRGFQKQWRLVAMTLPWRHHKLALETETLIKKWQVKWKWWFLCTMYFCVSSYNSYCLKHIS